jgi:AbrB family looped-hinge helix DNA binding protein
MPEEGEWSPTFTSMVERKYRIVIPAVIRKVLQIEEGDVVEVRIRKVGKGWKILRT